ncbi:hypothetical protein [Azohydromonas lata]|uniref:hypothetical protein n=1 Tax=Azohydromonas lata TaxID=45677 RepID=UPI0008343BBF|nr:hypothetical protein [Azohydromonas lata]
MTRFFLFSLGLLLGFVVTSVFAHGGEDHGPPAVVNARPLLPRVMAHSELFELVGVLEPGGRLLLWLDAAADNAPVAGASVDVEGAGANAKAAELSAGVYELKLPQAPAVGQHPMTFTVQAGSDMDLLGAPLVVAPAAAPAHGPADAPATVPAAGEGTPRAAWLQPLGWIALGAAGMGAAMAAMSARRRRRVAGGR